jgi:hypothetical protein
MKYKDLFDKVNLELYRDILLKENKQIRDEIINESLLSIFDPIETWVEHFVNSPKLAGKPIDKIKQHAIYAYMRAKKQNIPYINI